MKSSNPTLWFADCEIIPNHPPAKSRWLNLSARLKIVYFFFFVLGLSSMGRAQSPADCKTGCTSNDVQIQAAYLSDASGNALAQNFICPVSGSAYVYLTLELTTRTPRVGVVIYTKVKNFTPPSTIGGEVATISQCFGTTLNQPTNKVTFTSPFYWQCGAPIVLTDVFIGWGTGNTNFCTGNGFQCPATSSKCYSLPPGQYIPIQTPSARPASATECSIQPGGTIAQFNLTALEATVKGSQTNVTVTWFSDINLTTPISSPSSHTCASGTVYAKVASNTNSSVFSKSAVTLTVTSSAAAPVLAKEDNCDGTTTITATGLVNGALLTWSDGGSGNPRTVSGAPNAFTVTQTVDGCTSGTSNSVTPAPKSNPSAPAANVVQPTCGTPTGTITVTGDISGLLFSINSTNPADFTNNTGIFSGLSPATYLIRFKNSGGCISEPLSKTISAASAAPSTPVVAVKQAASCSSSAIILEVTSPLGSDYQYSNNNGTWQSGTEFTINAGDGYNIKARRVSDNTCVSGIASCGAEPITGGRSAQSATTTTAKTTTTTIDEVKPKEITVNAYPNPFNDKINFLINSPVTGSGSLEIYNALGQKIKNVHQGMINRGSQSFELKLPLRQTANLIYVLRVGDQRISGKILQLNR